MRLRTSGANASTIAKPTSRTVAMMMSAVMRRRSVFIISRISACANAGDTGCRVPRRKGLPTNACMDVHRIGCRDLKPNGAPVKIVCVGAVDLDGRNLADTQRAMARHVHAAVDLRRIALGAAPGTVRADLINDHRLARSDLALEALRRNRLLALHEPVIALLLHLGGDGGCEIVADRAGDRLVAEAADAIE